ncbi:hypothetical protein F5B17DRAFT_282828 [Nemania serpens]|nr:hypothetical protein F5B17DRAFT_282828 [Nemania serpens]
MPWGSALTWLEIFIILLIIDSVVELALISRMVAWLNRTASQSVWHFTFGGEMYSVSGLPEKLLLDQGHASNGAAGTAAIVAGLGGVLALWLRRISDRRGGRSKVAAFGRWLYYMWLVLSIPALLLTTGAFAYVFAVTNSRARQRIDPLAAASHNGTDLYPLLSWTPQNWFSAVLRLELVQRRSEIQKQLAVMKGWQYNLIAMFLIQLCQTVLAGVEHFSWQRHWKQTVTHTTAA